MKEFAASKHQGISLAGVGAELLPDESFDYSSKMPRRPFRGSLRAVAQLEIAPPLPIDVGSEQGVPEVVRPRLIRQVFRNRIMPKRMDAPHSAVPIITTDEFIQVKLATVRESTRHCYWPSDVVAKFLAAEVITRGSGQ
ncbi:MAG: hypothetical protein ACREBG_18270 [Pyrinomonadaceae bacterium]